jgi:HSP20 family protein
MADAATKLQAKAQPKVGTSESSAWWHLFNTSRVGVDRLFEHFDGRFWNIPFNKSLFDDAPFKALEMAISQPAVDFFCKAGEYEITAELLGIDDKDIEVKLSKGGLLIKGEMNEEREEKKKDYFLSVRRYGSFEHYFRLPDGIDTDKIAATFKEGLLTVKLPKTPEAQKQEKKTPLLRCERDAPLGGPSDRVDMAWPGMESGNLLQASSRRIR